MKTNKLLAAGALALSMAMTPVASLLNAMPVFADATVTLPTEPANHSYVAYKIFKGSVVPDSTDLTQIEWADEIPEENRSKLLEKAVEIKGLDGATSASTLADKLATANNKDSVARQFAKVLDDNKSLLGTPQDLSQNNKLATGYWLLVDTTNVSGLNDYAGLSILQVATKDITIAPKNNKPGVDKEVQDNDNKDTKDTNGDWGYTADMDLHKSFKFRLTANSLTWYNIKNYDAYKLVFRDTWSDGITYGGDDTVSVNAVVTTNGTSTTIPIKDAIIKSGDQITEDTTDKLQVTIADLKAKIENVDGLSDNSTIVVTVEYSASLNENAIISNTEFTNKNEVYLEYSNNPSTSGTGKTEHHDVFVGSYEIQVTKEDKDHEKLEGAQFVLKNSDQQFAEFNVTTTGEGENVKTIYKFAGWVQSQTEKTKLVTDKNGLLFVDGVDEGVYTLKETVAPSGYTIPGNGETTITINADRHEKVTVESQNKGVVTLDENSNPAVTVENSKISNLPETGGMGTTVIYGVGAVMVAGAAVFYVTNKRTRKD